METVYEALEQASTGFGNVIVISHSAWNEGHKHCSGARNWVDMKSKYQPKGFFLSAIVSPVLMRVINLQD